MGGQSYQNCIWPRDRSRKARLWLRLQASAGRQFQEANAWTQDDWLDGGGAGDSLAGESQEPLLETGPAMIAAPRAQLEQTGGLQSVSLQLSVCIPCYVEPPEVLQTAIDSAAMQLPEESELLIFPNGPEALAATESVTIPEDARVIPSKELLSMAGNWNRCLGESRGELIHILHADDAVAPGFYQAVLELAARYPQAALYATGFGPLVEGVPASIRTHAGETRLLAGEAGHPEPRLAMGVALAVVGLTSGYLLSAYVSNNEPFRQDPFGQQTVLQALPDDFPLPDTGVVESAGRGSLLPYRVEWQSDQPVSEVASVIGRKIEEGPWELVLVEDGDGVLRLQTVRLDLGGYMDMFAELQISGVDGGSVMSLEFTPMPAKNVAGLDDWLGNRDTGR